MEKRAGRSVHVAVRLTPQEYERVYRLAENYGMAVATFARAIVLGRLTPDGQPVVDRKPLPGQRAML